MIVMQICRKGRLNMKVGIIVHSFTGNTLSVAERIKTALHEAGHSANIERVTAVDENPSAAGDIRLESTPDTSGYDAVIFGAPVRGFSLSPVMKAYLLQHAALQGKKVGCFVTQRRSKAWLGGNRAVGQMKDACASKGADVIETGIVNWSGKSREEQIADIAERFGRL